jgi:hypothetical protein
LPIIGSDVVLIINPQRICLLPDYFSPVRGENLRLPIVLFTSRGLENNLFPNPLTISLEGNLLCNTSQSSIWKVNIDS